MEIKRKRQQPLSYFKLLYQFTKFTCLGVIVLGCIFVANHVKLSRHFPIHSVKVYGVNHVNANEVQVLLTPMVTHGFFSLDIESIRGRLLQIPEVADIYVRRHWPDQVEITIVEKQPIARWNQQTLLSDAGEVFSPKATNYPKDLPHFIGPDGQQVLMLEYFNEMNRLLTQIHAKISYLELTSYLLWKLKLDNGIYLTVGHKDILTRIDQFVKVYAKIVGDRAEDVEYVDLRYPNGMAVKWKAPVKT